MFEGAFDTAYGRLSSTRVALGAARDEARGRGGDAPASRASRDIPRSRLLPRLALMAPRRSVPLRDGKD